MAQFGEVCLCIRMSNHLPTNLAVGLTNVSLLRNLQKAGNNCRAWHALLGHTTETAYPDTFPYINLELFGSTYPDWVPNVWFPLPCFCKQVVYKKTNWGAWTDWDKLQKHLDMFVLLPWIAFFGPADSNPLSPVRGVPNKLRANILVMVRLRARIG